MTVRDGHRGRSGADAALLAALAGGSTVEGAAKTVGISEATATRRMRAPEFRAQLAAIRVAALERAVGLLSMASVGAAAELLKLCTSARSEHVRLAAARGILELGQKLREAGELEERLQALEAAATRSGGRR